MTDLELGSVAGGFGFLIVSAIATALLLGFASIRLRAWYPAHEPITAREPEEHELKAEAAEKPQQKYRVVKGNPVLWREVKTRAYGRKPILVKLGFLLICGIVLAQTWKGTFGNPPAQFAVNEDGEEIVAPETG